MREAQQLRADADPEHDLDDHHRQRQAGRYDPRHERSESGDDDHREEGFAVDLDHGRGVTYEGVIPQVPVNGFPGSRWIRASPDRNALGGHVIGSTARLRRSTS